MLTLTDSGTKDFPARLHTPEPDLWDMAVALTTLTPSLWHTGLVLPPQQVRTEQEREGQISSSTKWSIICDVQLTDGVQINIHIFQVSYQTRLNSILKFPF